MDNLAYGALRCEPNGIRAKKNQANTNTHGLQELLNNGDTSHILKSTTPCITNFIRLQC